MKKLIALIPVLFVFFCAKSQSYTVPRQLPYKDTRWVENTGVAGASYLNDSVVMFRNLGDTQMKPLYPAWGYFQGLGGDSTFWVWDMVRWKKLTGSGGGGGGGSNNTNLGLAYRWLNETSQGIKTANNGFGIAIDSLTTGELTFTVDTSQIPTRYTIDSLGDLIGGGTLTNITGTNNYGFEPIVTSPTASTRDIQVSTLLTSGSIPFIGTNGALRENNDSLYWDSTHIRMGIQTDSPKVALQVGNPVFADWDLTTDTRPRIATQGVVFVSNNGTDAVDNAGYEALVASNAIDRFPFFSSRRSHGTVYTPTATQNNDTLMRFGGGGYTGSAWQGWNSAAIEFMAAGNYTTSSTPGAINFRTTPVGGTTIAQRMQVRADGNITINALQTGATSPTETGTTKMVITDANGQLSFADIPGGGGQALTKTDDANVTLTLGGSPTTALLAATSLTLGWTGQLSVARGGTGQSSYTDGQLLIGNSSTGGLSKATLTAGSNITITNGNGSITIASTGGGSSFTRQVITSGSSGTVTGGNYIVTIDPSATLASYTLTLPASPSDLDVVEVDFGGTLTSGMIVTALTISANSGQTILDNSSPTSAMADNTLLYRYRAANTTWYRFKPL